MNDIIKYIFPNFIWSFFLLIVWSKILNKKINFKTPKYFFNLILLMVVSLINYLIVVKIVRIVLITIIFMFLVRLFFKEPIRRCIVTPIFYQLIMFTSEFICVLLLTFVFKFEQDFLLNNFLGLLLTNLLISLISYSITSIPFVIRMYDKITDLVDSVKINSLTMLCLSLIIILNLIDVLVYCKISIYTLMFINFFITFICVTIILNNVITHNKYNKVYDKYNIVISSLKSYEEMMKKYKILNHENKNKLLTIRSMIVNKEKNIPKYIDELIKLKINDDEKLLFKVSVIPSGGLRAAFYSKILKIKDNNIKYDIKIDNRISSLNFLPFNSKTIIDISNIFSVFVDNAIDETLKFKDKFIIISMLYIDEVIELRVSNYVDKFVDISKIYDEGFSTKGNDRGYGLPLVLKTVNENSLLKNKTEIQKNLFTQILLISLKK